MTSKPSMSSMPVRQIRVVPVAHSRSSGSGRRPPRRPLMGLVTLSNEASFVGTMTSGGTDVIEMSASTARFTAGAAVVVVGDCVSREVGIVEKAVTTVVGASVEATDDAVETGAPDELGATTGAEAVEAHAVVRSIKATRHRTRPRRGFDLTALSPRVRASVGGPDETQYSPLITKYEPRMVPASFDFWVANLNREASSSGTSIPSESLNPTARFPPSSTPYITLIESPLS